MEGRARVRIADDTQQRKKTTHFVNEIKEYEQEMQRDQIGSRLGAGKKANLLKSEILGQPDEQTNNKYFVSAYDRTGRVHS